MTTRTDTFSAAAIRASFLRRFVQMGVSGDDSRWTHGDNALGWEIYAWLKQQPDLRMTLPTSGISVDGLPDVDWSAIDIAELDRLRRELSATVSESRPQNEDAGEPLSRVDLRIAIRRRLADPVAARRGLPELQPRDAQCLRELYEYLSTHRDAPAVFVPSHVGFDGRLDVDWSRISARDLSSLVRAAYRRHRRDEGATAAPGPRGDDRGARIRDDAGAAVHEPASFAAFVELRTRRREGEAQRLIAERTRFRAEAEQIREAHFAVAAGLFDETTPAGVRAAALRHHRDCLERDLAEHARERAEVLGCGRPWYDAMLEGWRNERGDRRDYASALKALYDDRAEARRAGARPAAVGLDPVLVGIPGVRRYRQDGAFVYTRRVDGGDAEMFRVYRETREVVVRSKDLVATEAAIVKAYELDGPPLTFEGSDEFCARCEAIAARHGFEVTAAAPDAQRAPAPSGATPSSPSAGSRSAATSPAPQSGIPMADLADYGDVVAWVKAQTGVDFVVALDPKHAVAMVPMYLTHTPMKQAGFDLVFVQTPGVEAVSGIVLPRGVVPAGATSGKTRVDLTIENGSWKARFDDQPATAHEGPENDIGRSRGR